MRRLSARLAAGVAQHPALGLIVIGLITVLATIPAVTVRTDVDPASLLNGDSPEAAYLLRYQAAFGAEDTTLLAVVESDPVTDATFEAVTAATVQLERNAAFRNIMSVTNTPALLPTELGVPLAPPFSAQTADLDIEERVQLAREGTLGTANLISDDGTVTIISARLDAGRRSLERFEGPAQEFRRVVSEALGPYAPSVRVTFGGPGFTRLEQARSTQSDLLRLLPLVLVALAALMWWFYRRWTVVAATVIAVFTTSVWTLAVVGLRGDSLNIASLSIPIIVMGVVVGTASHLVQRYLRERAAGVDPGPAAGATIEAIGPTIILCVLASLAGMATLRFSRLDLMVDTGVLVLVATGFAFTATTVCVPAFLALTSTAPTEGDLRRWATGGDRGRGGAAERYARWVTRPRVATAVVAVGGVALVAAIVFAVVVPLGSATGASIASDSPVARANLAAGDAVGGVVPVEIGISGPVGAFTDPDNIDRVRRFAERIDLLDGRQPVGLPALLDAAETIGLPRPVDASGVEDALSLVDRVGTTSTGLVNLVTPDRALTRLTSVRPDRGSAEFAAWADQVRVAAAEEFRDSELTAEVTGGVAIGYLGVHDLVRGLLIGLLIAAMTSLVILALVGRPRSLALVTVLPQTLPLAVGVAWYVARFDLIDPMPAVVLSLLIAVSADNAVHLRDRFAEISAEHRRSREAVIDAYLSVRRAIVSSNVLMVTAFVLLAVLGMPSTRFSALMGVVVLVLMVVCDVVLAPAGLALLAGRAERRGIRDRYEERRRRVAEVEAVLTAPIPEAESVDFDPAIPPRRIRVAATDRPGRFPLRRGEQAIPTADRPRLRSPFVIDPEVDPGVDPMVDPMVDPNAAAESVDHESIDEAPEYDSVTIDLRDLDPVPRRERTSAAPGPGVRVDPEEEVVDLRDETTIDLTVEDRVIITSWE